MTWFTKGTIAPALIIIGALLLGCGKKDKSGGGDDTPGPGPKPGRGDSIPMSAFPYDPTQPEVKIDMANFASYIPAKNPAAADWLKKHGKVGEAHGIMGGLSVALGTRREVYIVRSTDGTSGIACESLFSPDWRKASPGKSITAVGFIDVKQEKDGAVNVRLKDAHLMAYSGQSAAAITADQLGKEYSANAAEFDKMWKLNRQYAYVTGTLKKIDQIPLSSGGGVANKFHLAAGSAVLYCHIQNPRGVEEDPPKPGDKITVLVEFQGAGGGQIQASGVYVDKN